MAATKDKMKVIITGADGQLGRSLQDVLKLNEVNFLALSRKTLDISDLSQVREIIGNYGASVVINAAAYTDVEQAEFDPGKAFEVNQKGAKNIAIASRELNSRLVHISTDYVFSGKRDLPWKADSKVNPISVYGKSKLAGEISVRDEWPENSVIIRTAWLYSEYGKNFYKTILQLAHKEKDSIKVVNNQIGQPTNAADLASFIFSTLALDIPSGYYHATNSGRASWYEFARYIFELSGADPDRIVPISSENYTAKAPRPEFSVLDNSTWTEFGIKPLRHWQESARNAFQAIQDSLAK